VPSTKVREIAAMRRSMRVAARQKAVQVIEKLRGLRLTKAAECFVVMLFMAWSPIRRSYVG
jgi:hypothetical protein